MPRKSTIFISGIHLVIKWVRNDTSMAVEPTVIDRSTSRSIKHCLSIRAILPSAKANDS